MVAGWETRLQAYWSVFSGGMGYGYGHRYIFNFNTGKLSSMGGDVLDGTLNEDHLMSEGRQDMKHLRALMERHPNYHARYDQTWILSEKGSDESSQDLRICLRDVNRKWAYIYCTKGHEVTIDLSKFTKPEIAAYWFHPRNGAIDYLSSYSTVNKQSFDSPGNPGEDYDWVLILESESM